MTQTFHDGTLVIQGLSNAGLRITLEDDGYRALAGSNRRSNIETTLDEIYEIYKELIDRIFSGGQFAVQRFADGSYAFFATGDTEDTQQDRLNRVNRLITSKLGNPPKVQNAQNNQTQVNVSAKRTENLLYNLVAEIVDFTAMFSVEDNLPREIGQRHLGTQDNELTESFVSILGKARLRDLLSANINATIQRYERDLNSDLEQLCAEINSSVSDSLRDEDFVNISLRKEGDSIKIEVQVDGGPSYFEHLSDATKFLIAFHLIRRDREQKNYLSNVLIFDEPNKGFHPSAEGKVLNFLEMLARQGNQVILATHSQHMIDLDRTHATRIMGRDQDQHLLVYNKISEVPNSQEGTLALQPITDAIGLKYSARRVVKDQVVITEGYTELAYLRAFARLLGYEVPNISPVLGDGKIRTLVSFLISQGMSFKILVDETARKQELQEEIKIPDNCVFVVEEYLHGKPGNTVGIEDLISRKDFRDLLTLAPQQINERKLAKVSNSEYLNSEGKKIKGLLADSFSEKVSASDGTSLSLEEETRENFKAILEFCNNPQWFRV